MLVRILRHWSLVSEMQVPPGVIASEEASKKEANVGQKLLGYDSAAGLCGVLGAVYEVAGVSWSPLRLSSSVNQSKMASFVHIMRSPR